MRYEYSVICCKNLEGLVSEVNDAIREGWLIVGGLCFANGEYIQSLYKEIY